MPIANGIEDAEAIQENRNGAEAPNTLRIAARRPSLCPVPSDPNNATGTAPRTMLGFELATLAAKDGYDLIVVADEPLIDAAAGERMTEALEAAPRLNPA